MDFKLLKLNYTYIYIIHVIIIIIYMIFSILFVVKPDLFKGYSMDEFHNNFCEENKENIICTNKFKKKKLFYALVDGVAYDQLFELLKKDKYNITRIFRGVTSDYKQSSVNHQIMFSGKMNRNFVGKAISEDNIFLNLYHTGKNFTFRGIKMVVFTLVGHFFDKRQVTPTEKNSMDSMCDIGLNINDEWIENFLNRISDSSGYFKDGYDKQYFYDELDKHFSKELKIVNERGENDFITKCLEKNFKYTGDENIIYYGNKIDHINHSYDKNHVRAMLQIYLTEKLLVRLIYWCYDHPEYAFFYASDHGGQKFYGEDNIVNHGDNSEGNEAGLFGWTKDMADNYDKLKLPDKVCSLYDFSTLVSQLVDGGVIPLESLGVPYPLANDKVFFITSIKAKVQQILKYIELFIKKYPKNINILKKYNDKLNEIYDKKDEELVEKFEFYIKELKNIQKNINEDLNENNKNIFFNIAFYIILLILGLLIIYDIYTLKNIVNTNINLFILSIIFGVYFLVMCVSFYPSDIIYNKLYTGTIIQYYAFSFLIVCYLFINKKKLKRNQLIFILLFSFLIFSISLFAYFFYKYEIFLKMKSVFTHLILNKTCNLLIFFPCFAFYMFREISKLKGCYYDKNYKYSAYKISLINGILIFIFMAIFEILLVRNFEVHTIYSLTTNYFVYAFLIFFLISCFLRYYTKNDEYKLTLGISQKVDGLPLLKFFLMLYQFYLSDESERILLLFIIMPILELFANLFLRKEKMWKLLILICFMGFGEIFYLITQRFYSFDVSIKVLSRTIAMTGEALPVYSGVLMATHKLRYFMLITGYLMSLSRFYKNKEFFTTTSFMIRFIPCMQLIGKIIYFYYKYANNLVGEEFLELFMWTMLHVIIFAIDTISLIIYTIIFIFREKKQKLIELKEEVKTSDSREISIDSLSNP